MLASFVSGKIGGNAMDWHGKFGLAILGLLTFRLVWGIVGSTYARFASFFPTPASVLAYLRGQWRGVGHNPLGALSVFGLLGLLAFQVASGLFGNDDIAFRGPLYDLIGKDLSDRLTGLHKLSVNALIALVVLHLAAIFFYIRIRKNNLLKPMLTGWQDVEPGQGTSATGGGPIALRSMPLPAPGCRQFPRHPSRRQRGKHERLEAACGQPRFCAVPPRADRDQSLRYLS